MILFCPRQVIFSLITLYLGGTTDMWLVPFALLLVLVWAVNLTASTNSTVCRQSISKRLRARGVGPNYKLSTQLVDWISWRRLCRWWCLRQLRCSPIYRAKIERIKMGRSLDYWERRTEIRSGQAQCKSHSGNPNILLIASQTHCSLQDLTTPLLNWMGQAIRTKHAQSKAGVWKYPSKNTAIRTWFNGCLTILMNAFRNDMFSFFNPLIQKILDGVTETATAVDWSVDVGIVFVFHLLALTLISAHSKSSLLEVSQSLNMSSIKSKHGLMMSRFQLQSPMACFPKQSLTAPWVGKFIQPYSPGLQSCTTVLKPHTSFLHIIWTSLAARNLRTSEDNGGSVMDGNPSCKRYE